MNYKYYLNKTIFLIALIVVFSSCEETNSLHERYLEEGEITYRAKPDSTFAQGGFKRAKINWKIEKDHKITKSIISWNSGENSLEVDLDRTNDDVWFSKILDSLDEGSYFFSLVNTDNQGNTSIPVEFETVVFGDLYVQSLKNRIVHKDVSPYNFPDSEEIKGAEITFGSAPEGLLNSIFEYSLMDGSTTSVVVAPAEMGLSIEDIDITKPVYIKSAYKPSENALDTVYTDKTEYMLTRRWNVALGKTVTSSSQGWGTVNSTATDGDLNSNWPNVVHTDDPSGVDTWVEVDLGEIYDISRITVIDRGDCCQVNNNFHVFVSENQFASSTVEGIQAQEGVVDFYTSGQANVIQEYSDLTITGRYVRIQNHDLEDGQLAIGEIVVIN